MKYQFIMYFEEYSEKEKDFVYNTVCKDENNLYYYGGVCNVGFLPDSEGFESLDDLLSEWILKEVLGLWNN